jgi:hypothetical protein
LGATTVPAHQGVVSIGFPSSQRPDWTLPSALVTWP